MISRSSLLFLFPSVVNGTDLLPDLFVVVKEDSPLIFRAIAFPLAGLAHFRTFSFEFEIQ